MSCLQAQLVNDPERSSVPVTPSNCGGTASPAGSGQAGNHAADSAANATFEDPAAARVGGGPGYVPPLEQQGTKQQKQQQQQQQEQEQSPSQSREQQQRPIAAQGRIYIGAPNTKPVDAQRTRSGVAGPAMASVAAIKDCSRKRGRDGMPLASAGPGYAAQPGTAPRKD